MQHFIDTPYLEVGSAYRVKIDFRNVSNSVFLKSLGDIINSSRNSFNRWSSIGSVVLDTEIIVWTTRIVTSRQQNTAQSLAFPDDA